MIIAIDFDGTIVEHQFPMIGNLLPMAKEVINWIYDKGHDVIIWTCRSVADTPEQYKDMVNFLNKNGIHYSKINENSDKSTFKPFPKIFAHVYIDDRNFNGFPGWEVVKERMMWLELAS